MRRVYFFVAITLSVTSFAVSGCDNATNVIGDGGTQQDGGSSSNDGSLAGDAQIVAGEPWANVYERNPTEDNRKTSKVKLEQLSDKAGLLTGRYANVFNCTQKDGGQTFSQSVAGISLNGRLCNIEKVARPSKTDGTYLHIVPPKNDLDGNDSFAEVMMYHHMTQIHDYFAKLGFKKEDKPLRAIVNMQVFVDLLNRWMGILNAAFVPKESGTILQSFGIDINKGEDTLIFSEGEGVDTAYDASVIYHEFAHSVVGLSLTGVAPDQYGVDATPGAMNEAIADYFAASKLNNPNVGVYALAAAGAARDLTRPLTCPDHLIGEVHYDGEVAGGALWQMRTMLGAKIADQAVLNAVSSFAAATGFEPAAELILAEVEKLAPSQAESVRKLFTDRGLIGCVRVKPHVDFSMPTEKELRKAPQLLGKQQVALPGVFKDGVPAVMQYRTTINAGTKAVRVTYQTASVGIGGLDLGMGSAGGTAELSIAFRRGADPIIYTYDGGAAKSNAHLVVKGATSNKEFSVTLGGSCVAAGNLVFQFLNHSDAQTVLQRVSVTQLTEVPTGASVFETCP